MSDDAHASPKYFVEFGDQQFGPADLNTLIEWKAQGRLLPDSVLIEETTQRRLMARDLPALFAPSGPPPVAGQPYNAQIPPPGYAGYPPPRKGFPTWAIVLCVLGGMTILCCPILAAILFPVFSQAKMAAKKVNELSHLKELGLGTLIYTNDWDDVFPPAMASALEAKPYLLPYVKPSGSSEDAESVVFISVNPDGGNILGDPRLAGKTTSSIADPRTAVMFYDEKPWSNGNGLACYVDGHAKSESTFDVITEALNSDPFIKTSDSSAQQP